MKTICITGATSGFGRAAAQLFSEHGWQIIAIARREERLNELKNEFKNVHTFVCDVRIQEDVIRVFKEIENQVSSIDALFNNAGLARGRDLFSEGKEGHWHEMLETNVNGLIYVTKAALPLIRKARAPYIVNVGSIAGRENYLGGNIYSASKAAVKSLTASLRLELASEGIRVGEIAPGAAETEFSLVRFEGDESKAAGVYTGFTPLHAIDIASALYYMCTLPEHVCIPEMVIMPTVQPNANTIYKK